MIFIAASPGDGLSGHLAAAIAKRRLPIIVSQNRQESTYILAAYAQSKPGPPRPPKRFTSSAQAGNPLFWDGKAVLADAQTHAIVWSAEFHGPCPSCDTSSGGSTRPIAERFIKRFQRDLFARESISDRSDDIIAP
jgi:hypothetical protein